MIVELQNAAVCGCKRNADAGSVDCRT